MTLHPVFFWLFVFKYAWHLQKVKLLCSCIIIRSSCDYALYEDHLRIIFIRTSIYFWGSLLLIFLHFYGRNFLKFFLCSWDRRAVYILHYFFRLCFSYQSQINSDEALFRKYAAKYSYIPGKLQAWTALSMF